MGGLVYKYTWEDRFISIYGRIDLEVYKYGRIGILICNLENTRIELVYMKLCIFPCLPNRDKFKEKFVIKNKLVKKTLLEIN